MPRSRVTIIKPDDYKSNIVKAIEDFWATRNKQKSNQKGKIADTTNRSAVTGGKQFNGFLSLLSKVAIDAGIPKNCIYLKGNQLPGFFRPTKEWDFLIISPNGKLIAAIELKSQVGSFGNNFNNRTEEALGSAVDLWTAFRENAFPNQSSPWVGYLLLVEKSKKSTTTVRISEPYFKVFEEFRDTNYLERYKLFCQKLMLERHYTQSCLIWTSDNNKFGDIEENISLTTFLYSFIGHIAGQLHEFKSKP